MARRRISIQRAYEDPVPGSFRVLVDRLWPRGVTKDAAGIDRWAKEAAPSTELRRWYGHDPERFDEFANRYRQELRAEPAQAVLDELLAVAAERPVVLVTATKDVTRSGAAVLRAVLDARG